MRILHLSDLHFGYDRDKTQLEKRNNYLESLLKQIGQIKNIDYIIISGDIGWHAKPTDYEAFATWIKKLLDALKIEANNLFLCPGNHDIDREIAKHIVFPNKQIEANELLKVEELEQISRPFSAYEEMCKQIGVQKYQLRNSGESSYLVGVVKTDDANFVCFNSAWYAKNDTVEDQMWVGSNFIETILSQHLIDQSKITIAFMHHPKESLIKYERTNYINQKNTYKMITESSDLLLYGHTHEISNDPIPLLNKGFALGCGATYESDNYQNSFFIYEVNEGKTVSRTQYIYLNTAWNCIKPPVLNLDKKQVETDRTGISIPKDLYDKLMNTCISIENISSDDFQRKGKIIWPVVPRINVTHIHQAQIELMSLMSNVFGWEIDILISDCGSKTKRLKPCDVKRFVEKITKLMSSRAVKISSLSYLHQYFSPQNDVSGKILESFIQISSLVTKEQLEVLKNKKYSQEIKDRNNKLPVLDHIMPLLQMAVVCYLANNYEHQVGESNKALIIAGDDEIEQWRYVFRELANSTLGALLIPTLCDDERINSWQQGITQYVSLNNLKTDISKGNMAFWCYCMFIRLQELNILKPISNYHVEDETFQEWKENQFVIPKQIDPKLISNEAWKLIGLAI